MSMWKPRWPWRKKPSYEPRDYIRFDYDTRYVTISKPGLFMISVPMADVTADTSTGDFTWKHDRSINGTPVVRDEHGDLVEEP